MIHGFYFRFLKVTHSIWISVILAKLAYCVFFVRYCLERFRLKKRIVKGNPEEAKRRIQRIYPDPKGIPNTQHVLADEQIDLSIIIPIYNYADLIETCIESVLNQKTRYIFELILVDDGSTDGAQDIVKCYASRSNVKAFFQKNQGIAGARNTGLNHAAGRYIMFVDCDDTVEEDLVETLMSKAQQTDADIVMCGHNLVKERDGVVNNTVPNIYVDCNLSGYHGDARILNYAGLPWAKVYKRELWENVRFLPGYWYEDTIIHALLFTQCKKFAYVPKICYQYRWYEKNFSHTQGKVGNPKCIDRYWMLVPILEKARELGIDDGECFYTMLIKHLSAYYYPTVSGMDAQTVDDLFVLACDLFRKYKPKQTVKLPYMLRVTEKALLEGDINLWKLAIRYQ